MRNIAGRDLTGFFNPNSIAIVGASRDEKKIGHIVLKNIVNSGFRGNIFPVNQNAVILEGMDCYSDYKDLPAVPDLAILSIPAVAAVELLEQIAKKGTKNIIVFSSGFKEAGPQGEKLENRLRLTAEKRRLNILGPNCLGFVNTANRLNATFSQAGGAVGNLRFISQSGALASGIFDWARRCQLGFCEFITLGNKAVLNENDILRYWLAQTNKQAKPRDVSHYRPVGMYLESIDSGKEFLNLISKISVMDPVFILKPGKSSEARAAIHSHTGAMAGDDAVLNAAFEQAGAIRCDGVEDMFDLARIFSWIKAPRGSKVAIVSNAGGPAVISADALKKYGLQMAILSKKTRQKLKKKLPRAANILNPIDVLGDALADRYGEAVNDVLAEKEVDALLVILTPQTMTEISSTAEIIGRLAKKHKKPVVCSFIGGELIEKGEEILNHYKIPSFRFPERAIRALAKMWQWRLKVQSLKFKTKPQTGPQSGLGAAVKSHIKIKSLAKNTINEIIRSAKKTKHKALSILEADKILNLHKIKTPKSVEVKNLDEARQFVEAQGWPVVLKISSPEVLHKTEIGGIIKCVNSLSKLELAWKKINKAASKLPKKFLPTIVAQKHIPSGLEVIVGIKYNENFGYALLFGAGGILTELISDRNLKLLPVDKRGAGELIVQSKVYPLLKGFMRQKPYALKKLTELIVKLCDLTRINPQFEEITVNPVIVTEKEAFAADARIILKD
jgi:acetate---CoA ligase (ADP-forming)